jgi:rhamnulokinase
MPAYASIDLGAESGRVIRGELRDGRLALAETARFPTGAERIDGHLRWDLPRFLGEIEKGLAAAAARGPLDGVGADTWGVDFGLLGEDGELLELPVAYRDPRTEGVAERFFEAVAAEEVYRRTGIQVLPFNTLLQLKSLADSRSEALARARRIALLPDLVHHHLSGVLATEWTDATTTQCVNASARAWDTELIEAAGADPALFGDLTEPGLLLGSVRAEIAARTGLGGVPVIVPATHDTASAVAAVPATGDRFAYLSSGTWSLLGVETRGPVITESARERNFSNEGGVAGTNRLLKNIPGLWLLQGLRHDLPEERDYEELTALARSAPAWAALLDPDDPAFVAPRSMLEAMTAYLERTGQEIPPTPGGLVRSTLESLALRYRVVLDELREVSGAEVGAIHVVGGGSRNRLLNQLTADATGLPVLAGPAEATAIGNLLVQAMGMGDLGSLAELREVVRDSFPPERFEPTGGDRVEEALERFRSLTRSA